VDDLRVVPALGVFLFAGFLTLALAAKPTT